MDEPLPLLDDAVAFVSARLLDDGPDLSPAYRVDGSGVPEEVGLDLPGYPGGTARSGNWVRRQFQLDTLGEVLQLFHTAARHDHLGSDGHRAAMLAVDLIEKGWQQPDAGIWELDDKWWTQSRLACVAGLRTMARIGPSADADSMMSLADAILAEMSRRCLDDRGAWLQHPGANGTDASLLIDPVRGALPPGDPRVASTLAAVHDELTEDGYVYRFRHGDQALGDVEGAFLLCGFFVSMAHWHRGETGKAFRWFERTRAACGPPGLFSEEFDIGQRNLAGNLPQAFVHAALLETATRLASEHREDEP
jgi:GH15 family glucan-1,4-alpha-glucosidase